MVAGLPILTQIRRQMPSGIDDFDENGQDELVAAEVIKEGRVVLGAELKSTIIANELSRPEKSES